MCNGTDYTVKLKCKNISGDIVTAQAFVSKKYNSDYGYTIYFRYDCSTALTYIKVKN
jgi:hypothetical protein